MCNTTALADDRNHSAHRKTFNNNCQNEAVTAPRKQLLATKTYSCTGECVFSVGGAEFSCCNTPPCFRCKREENSTRA
jgi:hypothetical protein